MISCPFVYSTGKRCPGHIVRIEAYKADIAWELKDEKWDFFFTPQTRYHLFCSEKGNHAGSQRPHDPQMKCFWREMPDEILPILGATGVGAIEAPTDDGT